jgi:hypothetical protein
MSLGEGNRHPRSLTVELKAVITRPLSSNGIERAEEHSGKLDTGRVLASREKIEDDKLFF